MTESKQAKHTPGPWQWYWRTGDNGEADCGVFHEKRPGQAYSVCRAPRYEKQEQWEANAYLITRAPDLLAENERLRSEVEELKATRATLLGEAVKAGVQLAELREAASEVVAEWSSDGIFGEHPETGGVTLLRAALKRTEGGE